MAEQKLIELAEAAASLTDAEAKACIKDGDNPCGGVIVGGGNISTTMLQPVVLGDETAPVVSNTFCPVGYVTKTLPKYVTRLFDVNFPYPELSYPYHGGLPISPSFAEASQFFRADAHVAAEEDVAKEIPDLEMETLGLTSSSLMPLKALDLLSDVSSRVVAAPEVAASSGGGFDYVSSNLSVVTLRVPDSSLPVSQTLGATAQSECEYSLHDVKMRLEVKANTGDFPPSVPYASNEGATFLSDDLPMASDGSGEVGNTHDYPQQQKGGVRWAGNAGQVDCRAQKYFSYLSPRPGVQTHLEPVHYLPAPSPAATTAAATATLPEISVFVPPNAQSKAAAHYSYSNHAMALPKVEYHRPHTTGYYKAETAADAKASVVKLFSTTQAKGKAVYKMFPQMPPPLMLVGGRAPATVLSAPVKRSEDLNPMVKTDIETEAAPQFDPLSIAVEEVCSQPHEKEMLGPFRHSSVGGSENRKRKSVLCCRSCFRCPSSSADFCLRSSPGEMPRGQARKLKLKKESNEAAVKNVFRTTAVTRRSRMNSTLRCHFCPRFFANTSNVARHIRIFHPADYKPRRTLMQNVGEPLARSRSRRCKSARAVSVGIQCTLVSSAADDTMIGSVRNPTTTTITKSEGSTPDYSAEGTAGSSGGGRAVVTSSFSGTSRSWGKHIPRHKRKSTSATVSAESDVSSSLTPRPAKTRERKTKQRKKTSAAVSIPPLALAFTSAVNVTRRGSGTFSTPRPNVHAKQKLPSSEKKLLHKVSSPFSSTGISPSSTSLRRLNFRTKPRTRVNSKIPCPYCPRFFSVMSNLKRHTRMQHSDVFVFDCNVCLQKFSMRRTLKKHMQDHADDRPFQCTECLSRFEFQDQLRVHGQRHVIEKFPCYDCGLTFYTLNHLKQHLQLHH